MSTSNKICNDGASKSKDDVCEVNSMLQNMNTTDDNNNDNKIPPTHYDSTDVKQDTIYLK